MATTQLVDVIVPEVYLSYQSVNSPEKTDVFTSGIVVRSALLDALANQGGNTFNIPFWNDLDSSVEANISSDNPATIAPVEKIGTGKQIGRSAQLNKWYSNADIASELAGSNANQQVRNRFGTYWTRQWQRRLIATCNGLLLDNVADNSGDMVVDIASESIAGQSASTKFSREALVNTVYSMGDMADMLTAVVVHSAIMKQLVNNDDIDYIPDSQGNLTIPTYMGLKVIVDDGMTVTAGTTDGFKYTTIVFGIGAFGYGEGSPMNPIETKREALQGNGAGVEYIGERKTWILHPFGYADVGTPTGESYTNAELSAGGVYSRVIARKSVPLAFLVTN